MIQGPWGKWTPRISADGTTRGACAPPGEQAGGSLSASHRLTWTLVWWPGPSFVQKVPKFSIHPLKSHSLPCRKVHLILPSEGETDGAGVGAGRSHGSRASSWIAAVLPFLPYGHSAEWTGIITPMRTEETQSRKLSSAFWVPRAVLNVWDTSISLTPCSDFLSWTWDQARFTGTRVVTLAKVIWLTNSLLLSWAFSLWPKCVCIKPQSSSR